MSSSNAKYFLKVFPDNIARRKEEDWRRAVRNRTRKNGRGIGKPVLDGQRSRIEPDGTKVSIAMACLNDIPAMSNDQLPDIKVWGEEN